MNRLLLGRAGDVDQMWVGGTTDELISAGELTREDCSRYDDHRTIINLSKDALPRSTKHDLGVVIEFEPGLREGLFLRKKVGATQANQLTLVCLKACQFSAFGG